MMIYYRIESLHFLLTTAIPVYLMMIYYRIESPCGAVPANLDAHITGMIYYRIESPIGSP